MKLSEELLGRVKGIAEQMIIDGAEFRRVSTEVEGIHVSTSLDWVVPLGGFELNGHYFYIGPPKKCRDHNNYE